MIKPIPQTTKGLDKDIQKIGCFFRSSQAIAEIEANKLLSTIQINAMWLWAKETGIVDKRNCMKCSAPIANRTLEVLGIRNKKFIEVATSQTGRITFYKSIPPELQNPKYYIKKILTINGNHFLVVDGKGRTIFDPDPLAREIKEVYTICYSVKSI